MSAIKDACTLILGELDSVTDRLAEADGETLLDALRAKPRVYVAGHGRSGLVARMFAMRLMHLGWTVHIVGETLTPGIQPGDLLVAVSGSGLSDAVSRQIAKAQAVGADCLLLTASSTRPAGIGLVRLPVGRDGVVSRQHAGSLFEQSTLVFLDAVCRVLQDQLGLPDAVLDARHSNLQ